MRRCLRGGTGGTFKHVKFEGVELVGYGGYGEVAAALIHRVTVGDDDGRWAHLLRKMASAVAELAIDVLPATM